MQSEVNILFLVLASALFALLMLAFVTIFILVTQKRSFKYNENITTMKKEYDSAVLNAQIEVQANTLQQVSEEIHDNIGQLLSLTKMNLGGLGKQAPADMQPLVENTKNIVIDIISEIRHLSKSISSRQIADFGLMEAISYQVGRMNKTGEIHAELIVTGENRSFDPPVELVIFRMVQELMNNAIKHSGCKNIRITMGYENEKISIQVNDDGSGFDKTSIENNPKFKNGTGLHSLAHKAKTINCSIAFNSNNSGTNVTLIKYFHNEKN